MHPFDDRLLQEIVGRDESVLATVIRTRGETYKKAGHRALYAPGDPLPIHGNIGTGCFDRAIADAGERVTRTGKPEVLKLDLSDPSDIHFGSGSFCGGYLEVLLEPITAAQKNVYGAIRESEDPTTLGTFLVHDLETGEVTFEDRHPSSSEGLWVESLTPKRDLVIFGATPLAAELLEVLGPLPYRITVVDWREAYLSRLEDASIRPAALVRELPELDGETMVVVLSHQFERDRKTLEETLASGCCYVGMLSSKFRRDRMFEALRERGMSDVDLDEIHAPIGLDIGGRADREIAISIAAELTTVVNETQNAEREVLDASE